jgi:hypothetical protein
MTNPDIAGHIAYIFIVLGIYLIGRRKRIGLLSQAVGCVIWVGVGIALELSSAIIWNIVIGLVSVHAYLNWKDKTI